MKTVIVVALLALGTLAAPVAGAVQEPICNEAEYPELCNVYSFTWELARCVARQSPCPP